MPAVQSTIAEREAELAALQSAFDEYITSSRELEEELDAELAKMQEKLADSSQANAALSSQLENIAPQLASLEKALGTAKTKLETESSLRREAELAQDEAEARCREMEGSLINVKEECDACHEELAFCSAELEETKLELEVSKARYHVQVEELTADLAVQKEKNKENDSLNLEQTLDQDNEYVKRLEDELELVTEQLIDAEQKLSEAEEALQQEKEQKSSVQSDSDEEKKQDETIVQLQNENAALQEKQSELKHQLAVAQEELTLVTEELTAAEQDSKAAVGKLEDLQTSTKQQTSELNKQVELAQSESRTATAELETLEQTLQLATQENVDLRSEVENLEKALDNAKSDHASLLGELEAVDSRFDAVRQEARAEGREAVQQEVQEKVSQEHKKQLQELGNRVEDLSKANTELQSKLDDSEMSLAEARDAAQTEVVERNAVVEQLQDQLARSKQSLEKSREEIASLKEALDTRVTHAEDQVKKLEKELVSTKGKLAEAEAHLIVSKKREGTKREEAPMVESAPPPISKGSRRRSRSCSPTSGQRREYQMDMETTKTSQLQKDYESLKDQHRMGEIRIKRLEEDLKAYQQSRDGTTARPPVMQHHLSSLALKEEEHHDIDSVLESRDPNLIAKELRSVAKQHSSQKEYNAQLLQKILSLQGNIQVACRVRPMSAMEIQKGQRNVVEALSETEIGCLDLRTKKWKSFAFDKVWSPDQSQVSVFQDVEPLALSVVDGYNACIFAYGQTGSGKTYTMEGIDEGNQHGISYRTIQKIFNLLNLRAQQQKMASPIVLNDEDESREDGETNGAFPSFEFSLEVGMLEIYNDEVYDLLSGQQKGKRLGESLDIRRNADGFIEVPGLLKETVRSIEDVMALLKRGNSTRATASTDLNEHSSRSHMVLTVDVSSGLSGQQQNKGKLYLVDLAGSERVRKSNVEGAQLKEAGFINKSLSALGNVMEALDRKASHVPYRDSKLTYLLQDSLGGNSRTMMVVTVCPMDTAFDESVHALQFATRVRRIQLGTAQRNVTSRNLEETVKSLTNEMKMLTKAKEKSESQLSTMKRDNTRIQERLQSISQSRAKSQAENRTLDVLRKNNTEMANRWQREKSMREQANTDLEKSKNELKKTQQLLLKEKRQTDSLNLKLQEKEQMLELSAKELRKARDASSAANIRARTAQIIGSRGTRSTPSATKTARSPSSRSTTTTTNTNVEEIREKVLKLLQEHDEDKVERIDIIMEKFKGNEEALLEKMTARYEDNNAQAKLKKRSELALARHKERMRARMESKK